MIVGMLSVAIGGAIYLLLPADVLKGISGNSQLNPIQLQMAIAG
jgi:hypothetical protein